MAAKPTRQNGANPSRDRTPQSGGKRAAPPSGTSAKSSPAIAPSPDVQAFASPHPFALTRVGVRGVRKPVTVHRPGASPTGVVATFDLFVDLPKHQKGTHMSRNLEALADVLDEEVVGRETRGLESLCERLAEKLLERHGYASHAQVSAEADYFLSRKNPGGKPSVEVYRILAGAEAIRGVPNQKSNKKSGPPGPSATTTMRRIGVQVVGMSACPCAMETVRHKLALAGNPMPDDIPAITHNQRNRVTLKLELPPGADVEAADLVDLCEAGLSAPTYELLKRGDEGDLVIQAHANPRFVEDVVREVLHRARTKYDRSCRGGTAFVSSEAEESIHKHNAYAERRITLGSKE